MDHPFIHSFTVINGKWVNKWKDKSGSNEFQSLGLHSTYVCHDCYIKPNKVNSRRVKLLFMDASLTIPRGLASWGRRGFFLTKGFWQAKALKRLAIPLLQSEYRTRGITMKPSINLCKVIKPTKNWYMHIFSPQNAQRSTFTFQIRQRF